MNCIGTYDGTIFYNPANKFCIVSVKTADQSVPAEARSNRRYKDHLIRFTAVGYEIPRTDAVELELDGEWTKGKYGVQLQVEQWREIVPRTKNGVEGYLASGLIKGIGPKTAADIVERFGVDTLDILEHQPERLLEIRGITESKLEDIKASYAENRMLQGIMTLLAPFKITPKTALKIYQYFGPTSVEILEKSPFELCQISGFGFRRVDAIVQKSGGNLHDSMRIKGAVFCALDEGKSKRGHLYISSEELEKSALKLLNEKIPVPELRLHQQEVRDMMQEMILNGAVVSVKDNIYLPRVFAQEDETARRIAQRLVAQMPVEHIAPMLEQVKVEMGLRLSAQQEAAVYAAFRHGLSVITGSPGTGKTTVLRTILEVYRRLHPDGKIALMAPTGRASRRMSESTGFEDARTLHSGLGLTSEEDEGSRNRKSEPLSADLIIVDEFSMVDMWLAEKFFERMKINARIVLVGDPDQLPSVGAGNVFREIIETKIVPVTVLDQIFRQSKDILTTDADWLDLKEKLAFSDDFVEQNRETVTEFLLQGGAAMVCALYGELDGQELAVEALRRIVQAELMGQFYKLKYFAGDLQREIRYPVSEMQESLWKKNLSLARGAFWAEEVDDFYHTLRLGELPHSTCLSYRTGSQRECLLAAFDSNKKIVLVKKDEAVVARACLRLTKGAFQKPPAVDFSFADLSQENMDIGKPVTSEKPVLFLESIYTFGLNDIEKEEVMKLAVSLTTQKAAELGVVSVLARRYLGCYERDEYVLAPFYVYISKSKNGWQYLDSLGGAAYTSAKEEYVEHPFLVMQTAMHHAEANSRNEVEYE